MEQQSSSSQTVSTPQIRSRITVVCAECKRLKLKCDRRTPCSSCTKRDTVARCIYSPAAAEKVDLHSLNNRLLQVESTLAQLTSGSFQSTYPPAQFQNVADVHRLPPSSAPPPSIRSVPLPQDIHQHQHHSAAVLTHVHDAPCPLALSLEELHSAWLDSVENGHSGRSTIGRPPPPIQIEPSPADIERRTKLRARLNTTLFPHSRHLNPQPLLPRVSEYYSETKLYGSPQVPSVTPAVLSLLPSPSICMRILARARPVLVQRPVPLPGGWNKFEQRAISLINGHLPDFNAVEPGSGRSFLEPSSTSKSGPAPSKEKEKRKAEEDLIFFSMTTAILAIGAAVSPPEVFDSEDVNAGVLYALSQQALSVWENSYSKKSEKDYVLFLVACLAGIGYLLLVTQDNVNDSGERRKEVGSKPRIIFAMVGKMVNIAREIGLGKEIAAWQQSDDKPSSRADSHRHWEDFRCVVWWDVMFYDLFTSDALGHPSLIPPVSHSVRLPELNGNLYDSVTRKYVIARCRLVELAQHVKHRLSHPECCCGYTFDQAARLEDEIRRWSRDFISQDENEKADELRHKWELSLVAQILILRVYVPFLISANSAAIAKQEKGTLGFTKVPGKPGVGEKPQIQGSAMAMATQSCLGAAQAIFRLGSKLNGLLCKESDKHLVEPLLMDLYPLERMVLDAVVITQSSTAVSLISETEVRKGMEIMMDREYALGRSRREIWENIKQRVAPPKLRISTQIAQQVVKRKHDQLSPVGTNSDGVTSKKKEYNFTKHAKPGPPPVLGIRCRQGRMGHAGPACQSVDKDYPRPESYTLAIAQPDPVPHGQITEIQHPKPHPVSRQPIMSYDDSPPGFPSEISMQVEPAYPIPHGQFMTGHHSSFEQTRPIFNVDEGPVPPGGHGTSDPNSVSSSPYQCTTRSDDASHHTPTSQFDEGSPAGSYGSMDGPTSGNASRRPSQFSPDAYPSGNSRPNAMTENSQPQAFDRVQLAPSVFSYSSQSPSANGISSPPENDAGSQFGILQHEIVHPSTGYFHHGSGLAPYDRNGMMSISMRMDESVPGTPIYEKPQMIYDKAPQQMLQHGGHPITVNGHTQIVNPTFVGEQTQGLATTRVPQPLSWTSVQSPQSLGVPAGQSYW